MTAGVSVTRVMAGAAVSAFAGAVVTLGDTLPGVAGRSCDGGMRSSAGTSLTAPDAIRGAAGLSASGA